MVEPRPDHGHDGRGDRVARHHGLGRFPVLVGAHDECVARHHGSKRFLALVGVQGAGRVGLLGAILHLIFGDHRGLDHLHALGVPGVPGVPGAPDVLHDPDDLADPRELHGLGSNALVGLAILGSPDLGDHDDAHDPVSLGTSVAPDDPEAPDELGCLGPVGSPDPVGGLVQCLTA